MQRQLRRWCALTLVGALAATTTIGQVTRIVPGGTTATPGPGGGTTQIPEAWANIATLDMYDIDGRAGFFVIQASTTGKVRARGDIQYPDGLVAHVLIEPNAPAVDPNAALDWEVIGWATPARSLRVEFFSPAAPDTTIFMMIPGGGQGVYIIQDIMDVLKRLPEALQEETLKKVKDAFIIYRVAAEECVALATAVCGEGEICSLSVSFTTTTGQWDCEFTCCPEATP